MILIDDSKHVVMGLHRPLLGEQQGSSHRSQRQDSAQSNVLFLFFYHHNMTAKGKKAP